jgi:hypothetical protein
MPQNIRKNISNKYCPKFGEISVSLGYITKEQLAMALKIQANEDNLAVPHRLLGSILFEHNWMSSDQVETVLNRMLKRNRAGTQSAIE